MYKAHVTRSNLNKPGSSYRTALDKRRSDTKKESNTTRQMDKKWTLPTNPKSQSV